MDTISKEMRFSKHSDDTILEDLDSKAVEETSAAGEGSLSAFRILTRKRKDQGITKTNFYRLVRGSVFFSKKTKVCPYFIHLHNFRTYCNTRVTTFLSLIQHFEEILSQVLRLRCWYDLSIAIDNHNELQRIRQMSKDAKILCQRHLADHPNS